MIEVSRIMTEIDMIEVSRIMTEIDMIEVSRIMTEIESTDCQQLFTKSLYCTKSMKLYHRRSRLDIRMQEGNQRLKLSSCL